jgi:hypothetical protein
LAPFTAGTPPTATRPAKTSSTGKREHPQPAVRRDARQVGGLALELLERSGVELALPGGWRLPSRDLEDSIFVSG